MFLSQADLLFPRHAVGPAGPLPRGAERIQLRTADGEVLHGVHIAPAGTVAGDERLLVLGFAGNAWNAENVATLLHETYPQAHAVAFHYRGYTPSTGAPSAEALLADAPAIYDLAIARVRPTRTIAVGFSLGSGVAAVLAGQRPLDGVILVTPFDSLGSVAQDWYPWLPVRALFQHEIDAAAALEGTRIPVAIVAAQQDQIVRPQRTRALAGRVPNLVFDRTVADASHNDIYARAEFGEAMTEALAAVGG